VLVTAGAATVHAGSVGAAPPLVPISSPPSNPAASADVPAPVTAQVAARPPAAAPARRTAQTLTRSTPVRIEVPSIGVSSGLLALGLRPDGAMAVPPSGFPAGWFTGGPTPGELGPAVIVGHVDWAGRLGVFGQLRSLAPGAQVAVDRRDGTTAVFRVSRVVEVSKQRFPTAAVYGNTDHAALRLITCGGAFDHGVHSYQDNIVAFADLESVRPTASQR